MKKIIGAAIGLAVLAVSTAASAHVDVAVGLGIPGAIVVPAQPVYEGPPPVAYAPPPPPVTLAYADRDDWRARDWQARRDWREREWRRHEWREHEWREHHEWRGY
ncbi:hypothetical protein [Paraburkholderia sp.]|uniref:hypothetical protein n=1 Tax=Paraburkholderia sp. TaxID=1926495 RepID=UPI0023A15FC4|nr:hypothetical protein [Paraburkholderia sp.]MDE1180748.1 hypothetical protein [Paraburkholderia sp.]